MDPVYPNPFSPPYFDTPRENIMNPICDIVENASTLLISVCVHAITAANKAEKAPTQVMICMAVKSIEKTGNNLATKNTPATTIVAAWINADTGVGPSIASGNQICNGNIADLPAPPINTNTSPHVSAEQPKNEAATIVCNWSVGVVS